MREDLLEIYGSTRRSNNSNRLSHIQFANTGELFTLNAQTADWVMKTTRKLESLGRLERNWDSYDGLPISPLARKMTCDILQLLQNQDLPVPSVALGSGGAVHLEWRSNGKELEIGFDDRGLAEYLKVDTQGRMEEKEDVLAEEFRVKLMSLAVWLTNG